MYYFQTFLDNQAPEGYAWILGWRPKNRPWAVIDGHTYYLPEREYARILITQEEAFRLDLFGLPLVSDYVTTEVV